jgi:L-ascorbate metabolism protein UlaG (beta-lactamase superfamily)
MFPPFMRISMARRRTVTSKGKITVTWFGHSAFKLVSPTGKVILIDPWLDNPKAPPGAKDLSRVDIILVTHGHGDHLGNTVEIARQTNARVVAIYEIGLFLQSRGLNRIEGINKSGSVTIDGIHVTMTHAQHSGGLEPGGEILTGGDPAGYVVGFENDFAVYHAGDTGLFGDMQLIGELYRPDLVLLPIGGLFTMGPQEAAYACRLLKPHYIIGMHYGTFPALAGTPAELKRQLPAPMRKCVRELTPGVPVQF